MTIDRAKTLQIVGVCCIVGGLGYLGYRLWMRHKEKHEEFIVTRKGDYIEGVDDFEESPHTQLDEDKLVALNNKPDILQYKPTSSQEDRPLSPPDGDDEDTDDESDADGDWDFEEEDEDDLEDFETFSIWSNDMAFESHDGTFGETDPEIIELVNTFEQAEKDGDKVPFNTMIDYEFGDNGCEYITRSEYYNTNKHYNKVSCYYYYQDMVLAENRDQEPMNPKTTIGGYVPLSQLAYTDGPSSIYVRNLPQETDYEIQLVDDYYSEELREEDLKIIEERNRIFLREQRGDNR